MEYTAEQYSLRRFLAKSNHPLVAYIRRIRQWARNISLPAPKLIFKPFLLLVVFCQEAWCFFSRIFVCEPLFKANCITYGKHVHTGSFIHYIRGKGNIAVGDNVLLDGKISIFFASRFSNCPTLTIGSGTGIGHDSMFTVAKSITIGNHCRLASGIILFDSPGHPLDPHSRQSGFPPSDADVKPITIRDNVWIGRQAIIGPGVTIGENSVIGAGSVVFNDVAPNSVMAGNPARRISDLSAFVSPGTNMARTEVVERRKIER